MYLKAMLTTHVSIKKKKPTQTPHMPLLQIKKYLLVIFAKYVDRKWQLSKDRPSGGRVVGECVGIC